MLWRALDIPKAARMKVPVSSQPGLICISCNLSEVLTAVLLVTHTEEKMPKIQGGADSSEVPH